MPSYAASVRISRGSGQAIWSARALCPYSRRLTPDEAALAAAEILLIAEFGSPGLAYPHRVFAVEAQDLARVKGNFCLRIANFGSINFHATLLDQVADLC